MIWQSAKFWKDPDGTIWHSLRGDPNQRDLSMGVCSNYPKSLAWCKSHNLKIDDQVDAIFGWENAYNSENQFVGKP